MLNLLKTIAHAGKDRLLSELARQMLNHFGFELYGEFTDVALNTQKKEIEFSLLLKGEKDPVNGTLHYHIEGDGSELVMVADTAKLDREWMNVAFERHVGPAMRRFVIPPNLHPAIRVAGI